MKQIVMKRLYLFIMILIGTASLSAENIKVKHFVELERDLSYRTEMKKDINNIPCAIIKVVNADASFTFEGNITDVVYNTGEIWLYVAPGIKRLTIKHGSATLRYEFPMKVEYATYELSLRSQEDFNKAGAIATSCFVPGVGQMAFKNDYLKGSLILATEAASIAAIVVCNSKQLSYKDLSDRAITADDKVNNMKISDNYGTARNIMIGVAAGIYVYNILDVILARPKAPKGRIALAPYIDNLPTSEVYGVNMAVRF